MLMGINPRLEREMVQALDERPVAFPLAMLAVTAVFALVLTLVAYGTGALSAPAPTELTEVNVLPDVVRECVHRCVSIR